MATLAGTGALQGLGMSSFSVPRIVADPNTPRPLDLSTARLRAPRDWRRVRRRAERAVKRIFGVS